MVGFLEEPEWFAQHRKKAFDSIETASLPPFRYGLSILVDPEFDFDKISAQKGKNTLEYSGDVEISKGAEALKDPAVRLFLTDEWAREDKLFYITEAYANEILLIKIPSGKVLDKPVEISYKAEGQLISKIFVLAGANTQTTILLKKEGKGSFLADDVRIITKENSIIDFVTINNISGPVSIQNRTSMGNKDSTVKWTDLCIGAGYTRSQTSSMLNAEGAATKQTVIFMGRGKQKYDIYTEALHNSPKTFSDLVTKGVLDDESKAVSRGLVQINENAAGSEGYEKQDSLLLSDKAEADAIPNLEINNHDVKCSHGATIGQVDAEMLFYLMSRGLNEKQAKQQIVTGYFTPVLNMFSESARRSIQGIVEEWS